MVLFSPNRFEEFAFEASVFASAPDSSILDRIDTIKKKVDACISDIKADNQYKHFLGDLNPEWKNSVLDFAFSMMGMRVVGAITVDDGVVHVYTNNAQVLAVLQAALESAFA